MSRQRPSMLARKDVAAPVRPVEGSGTRFRHEAATDVRDIHEIHAGEGGEVGRTMSNKERAGLLNQFLRWQQGQQ
jgi:hypothetical protein